MLLIEPFDYDILGLGTFSIHENNDAFSIRGIYGDADFDDVDFYNIIDAHLLGGPLLPKECIAENKSYFLNEADEITSEIELEGSFAYHEGLGGDVYQVEDGVFKRLVSSLNGSIELGNYNEL